MASIARLDTSVTPHDGCRKHFLQILQEISPNNVPSFEHTHDERPLHYKHSLHWLSIRRVPVETIILPYLNPSFLEDLRLQSLRNVTTHNIDDLELFHILNNHPLLVSLKMKGGRQRFTDLGIRLIGRLLPLLERLSIHDYDSPISCAAVIFVVHSCVKMKSIDLGEIFDNFSNADLIRLQEFGHLFEGLYFAGKLEEIRKCWGNQGGPDFEAMHFTRRREKIAHFVRLLSCCPQLSTLTCTNRSARPDAVGDTLIMSTAAETCCDLKVLDLSYFNFSTTPIGIFLNLREIRLSDCKVIPVSVFETIITMEKLEVF